jgi:hypothetical protein
MGSRMNSSKPVLAVLVVSCLVALLAACEPGGPEDVKLTAPPNAVAPAASSEAKVRRLRYTVPDSAGALRYARAELEAQGLVGCGKPASTNWQRYTFERDGQRVNTLRYAEYLFRKVPPRLATIEMLRTPEGVQVTVEVQQLLNGEVVVGHQRRLCG